MTRLFLLCLVACLLVNVLSVTHTRRGTKLLKRLRVQQTTTTTAFDVQAYTILQDNLANIAKCAGPGGLATTMNCVANARMVLKFCGIDRPDAHVALAAEKVPLHFLKYWATKEPTISVCEYDSNKWTEMIQYMKKVDGNKFAKALEEVDEHTEDHAFVIFHPEGDKSYIWDSWDTKWDLQARELTWPSVESLSEGILPEGASQDGLTEIKDMLTGDANVDTIDWGKARLKLGGTSTDRTKNRFVTCNVMPVTGPITKAIGENIPDHLKSCDPGVTLAVTYSKGNAPFVG